ncbi:NUDIX pyrophosphatase [Listeria monocytogenes]|uniref:NUDIX hydrolase n=1 Tax=Listeria monocytogenes TaxID=1639 RepID=UPI00085BEA20|nr:NUDIX pyrophosphatase [Listeria monocytogenes]EAG2314048.1 NUDIX pyrophosphatase [Listeria monocytogenes]EAG9260067.1 NUDIX pyrophosphatase [Listeria monocytogenes]EAG9491369.1 NUDIX pyrophosphatase [Listeria monocytogenes]EAK8452963.1 NUDIX pyrophosphatase [Listeria monocytogenes]OEP43576.1 NUDIX pyrophosphatase [Listeria monocytogenes]
MRQPFQVLVIPFMKMKANYQFGVLHRTDADVWQFVAGGGEDEESISEAAKRECREELNLGNNVKMYSLDSHASIPNFHFSVNKPYVVPEYCFAIELTSCSHQVTLSLEHSELRWVSYESAVQLLEWDSNKTALYELNERLKNNAMKAI